METQAIIFQVPRSSPQSGSILARNLVQMTASRATFREGNLAPRQPPQAKYRLQAPRAPRQEALVWYFLQVPWASPRQYQELVLYSLQVLELASQPSAQMAAASVR